MSRLIRITRIKEKKNGGAVVEFEYSKTIAEIVKNYYGKKRITKKLIAKFVKEGLINYVNEHSKVDTKDLELGAK